MGETAVRDPCVRRRAVVQGAN